MPEWTAKRVGIASLCFAIYFVPGIWYIVHTNRKRKRLKAELKTLSEKCVNLIYANVSILNVSEDGYTLVGRAKPTVTSDKSFHEVKPMPKSATLPVPQFVPTEWITKDELEAARPLLEDALKQELKSTSIWVNSSPNQAARLRVLYPDWQPDAEMAENIKNRLDGNIYSETKEITDEHAFAAAVSITPLRILFPEWHPEADVAEQLRPRLENLLIADYTKCLLAKPDDDRSENILGMQAEAEALSVLFDDWRISPEMAKTLFEQISSDCEKWRRVHRPDGIAFLVANLCVIFRVPAPYQDSV